MSWLQRLFGREEQKPAPAESRSDYRQQVPKAAQTNPRDMGGPNLYNRSTPARPAVGSQAQKYVPQNPQPLAGPHVKTPTAPKATTFAPSTTERSFLNAAGWKTPEPPPMTVPHESMTFENLMQAPSHTYGLSAEQAMGLQGAVTGLDGFVAPENKLTDIPQITVDASVAELSWDEYDKLTDAQKAAIDHNTRMVEARNKDVTAKATLHPEDMGDYNSKVKKIFGEGGGSDLYAPNLVNLLDEINFQAVGADLDEFLSLERAIDASELANFEYADDTKVIPFEAKPERLVGTGVGVTKVPGMSNYAEARSTENLAAIDTLAVQQSQKAIEAVMTDANKVLWDFQSTFKGREAFSIEDIPYGFGSAEERGETPAENGLTMDLWTQQAWQALKDPTDNPLPAIEEAFQSFKFTPEEQQNFWNLVNQKTKDEQQYGAIGEGRSAEEIRKMLGWKD
jgi:hypothetical protein